LYQTSCEKERVILIGTVRPGAERADVEETMNELEHLAVSAGAEVTARAIQSINRYDPAFFIGKGKAGEIAKLIKRNIVDTVIFDDDLTPAQVKKLSALIGRKIIDRTGLILEIFAQNARTREAKAQVELAQLRYQLPRLAGQWSHLERQVGGIGVRGPGETQLETDRRIVRRRIKRLAADLEVIERQRFMRRTRRTHLYKTTLVGYTNAGKSTLFNTLTDAGALVEDRLFATLDSTVRRLELDNRQVLLLADTVGFIRKLPHSLIASFRSTLGVVRDADMLLHVIDLAAPRYERQIDAVNGVLKEMGLESKPVLPVFNKIDAVADDCVLREAKLRYPGAVFVSALRGIGTAKLIHTINRHALKNYTVEDFILPVHETRTIARLCAAGDVLEQTYNSEFVSLRVRLSARNAPKFAHLLPDKSV